MAQSKKKSFEEALYLTLVQHNLLLPVNDEQVKEFEKGLGETHNLPTVFNNPETFSTDTSNLRPIDPDWDIYNLKVAASDDSSKPEDPPQE